LYRLSPRTDLYRVYATHRHIMGQFHPNAVPGEAKGYNIQLITLDIAQTWAKRGDDPLLLPLNAVSPPNGPGRTLI